MDRVFTCRSRADQSQNVFGNVFSDEINRVLRENRFSYRYILCSDEILTVLVTWAQLRPTQKTYNTGMVGDILDTLFLGDHADKRSLYNIYTCKFMHLILNTAVS